MVHSERTSPSRNGTASLGRLTVSRRPRSALRQNQLASPDQAEFALCEQTILAVSNPIMVTLIVDGLFCRFRQPALWHMMPLGGRPPHLKGVLVSSYPK